VGGGGGTGGGPRNRGPQLNPFGTPVRGIPGSKSLRPSRVSGRAGGMGLLVLLQGIVYFTGVVVVVVAVVVVVICCYCCYLLFFVHV
ncbi:unnamed protein product, partial [Polarella glacialis]